MSTFKDGRFWNADTTMAEPVGLLKLLRWKFPNRAKAWPKKIESAYKVKLPIHLNADEAALTFINHSTVLIQLSQGNVLTDPVFSEVVSPFSWLGPRRVRPPGLQISELPKIDIVLISHNHYDHLDVPSLIALWKKDRPLFIVPLENGVLLRRYGIESIVELDWWQEHRLETGISVSLTPAQHWSRRGLRDFCKTLWGSYVLQDSALKIFFAGDTGYNGHFRQIRERYGAMNVSLLPIGAYEPRWLMQEVHMDPTEAVQAHLDLKSELSIGIHFGTFPLTDEGIDDPVHALRYYLQIHGFCEKRFIAPEHGQTLTYRVASQKISSNLSTENTLASSLLR